MKSLIKLFSFGLLAVVSLALLSCPPPIDEDLLTFAEDSIPPEIELSSPSNNGTYRSNLKVKGRIIDSSVKSGDAKGKITTAFYAILDNSCLTENRRLTGVSLKIPKLTPRTMHQTANHHQEGVKNSRITCRVS